jgi:hypothetical protein
MIDNLFCITPFTMFMHCQPETPDSHHIPPPLDKGGFVNSRPIGKTGFSGMQQLA